jgi:putative pyruvate formate lyase activating enzyme
VEVPGQCWLEQVLRLEYQETVRIVQDYQPSYLALARSGELTTRAELAIGILTRCGLCPHACGVNRLEKETGICQTGRFARVASYGPHHGEEDCLRGWRGSGTMFFSGCSLRCVFCQNWDISHRNEGRKTSASKLADIMLELQGLGCHNLNWVTPTHVVPQLLEALVLATAKGLRLPIVYNTGGYDSLDTIRLLDGIVDIYMPDFKVWDQTVAARLLKAPDYPETVRQALREMHRQVGDLQFDADGLAKRGVLVRHLVLPGGLSGIPSLAAWIAHEISTNTYLNIMAQYHPDGAVSQMPDFNDLDRCLHPKEYRKAMSEARKAGLQRFDQRET